MNNPSPTPTRRRCPRPVRLILRWAPWLLAPWILVTEAIPTSYWFEARSVVVSDTIEGIPPAMLVDRDINRPFFGWWAVTVRKVVNHNGRLMYEQACLATGQGDYKTTAKIPADANLDWWTQPVRCNLAPGQYIVLTRWDLDVLGFRNRAIALDSNPFYVRPR